jgi:hypothetical protein
VYDSDKYGPRGLPELAKMGLSSKAWKLQGASCMAEASAVDRGRTDET